MINTTRIETVMVTLNDEVLDTASFGTKADAEAYKRGVLGWAAERGVIIRVWSQTASIGETRRTTAPALALAC